MKKVIIILMICLTSLSGYNTKYIKPYICFSTNDAKDIIKKLKLQKLQIEIISNQEILIEQQGLQNYLLKDDLSNIKKQTVKKITIFSTISFLAGSLIVSIIK